MNVVLPSLAVFGSSVRAAVTFVDVSIHGRPAVRSEIYKVTLHQVSALESYATGRLLGVAYACRVVADLLLVTLPSVSD